MKLSRLVLTIAVLLMTVEISSANNQGLVNRWYIALRTINRPVFDRLLSDAAKIELRQLGVVQTKAEFIQSLDNWEHVAGDLLISTTIASGNDTTVEVHVCYQFPDNSVTNREIFTFNGRKITAHVQEKLQDGC